MKELDRRAGDFIIVWSKKYYGLSTLKIALQEAIEFCKIEKDEQAKPSLPIEEIPTKPNLEPLYTKPTPKFVKPPKYRMGGDTMLLSQSNTLQ